MTKEELLQKLNSLQRYDLEWHGRDWMQSQNMDESQYGNWIKIEDLAKIFNLGVDLQFYELD